MFELIKVCTVDNHWVLQVFDIIKFKFKINKEYLITKLLDYLYKKNRSANFEEYIENSIKGKNLYIFAYRDKVNGQLDFIRNLHPASISFLGEREVSFNDTLITLGYGGLKDHIYEIYKHRKKCPILFFEAAFLRSILMDRSNSKYDKARCFFIDDLGHHYDSSRHSRIEELLNNKNFSLDCGQRERANNIIKKIHNNKLTKYNDQKIVNFNIGRKNTSKILVIEQAKSDYAILKSDGNSNSFKKMLEDAIEENPNADILIKIHPDTLNGKRGGIDESYYGNSLNIHNRNIYKIDQKINPYCLIDICDKVYVFSSMFGFEALLAGKEVHVYGNPIYSGWGLTKDKKPIKKRKVRRSLAELVYIIYVMYTHYYDTNGNRSDIECLIDELLMLRQDYFEEN